MSEKIKNDDAISISAETHDVLNNDGGMLIATQTPKKRKKIKPKPKPEAEYDENGNRIVKRHSQTKDEQARKKLSFNTSRVKWFSEYFTGAIPPLSQMHIPVGADKLLSNEDQIMLAELIQAGIAGKLFLNFVEQEEGTKHPVHLQSTIVKDQDQVVSLLVNNGYTPERFPKRSVYRKTLERLVRDGDEARNIFAEKNRGLVTLIVRRRRHTSNTGNADYDDLMAEGMNGLMIAIDHFNPDLGNLFSTPAAWWIDQPIRNYLDSKTKTIHMPTHMNNIYKSIYYAQKALRNKYSSDEEITDEMISDYCKSTGRDISVAKIQEARELRRETSSYDAPLGDEDKNAKSIVEMMASDEDIATDVMAALSSNVNFDKLLAFVEDGRKREILRDWYSTESNSDSVTLSNISRKYCFTKERVKALKNEGETELKHKVLELVNKQDISVDDFLNQIQ